MLVSDFIGISAGRFPAKTAIVSGDERLTFAALHRAVDAFGALLADAGVGRGDRVVIQLENSPAAAVAFFAVLRVGGVAVMLNASTKFKKLVHILNDCGAVVLVADGRQRSMLGSAQSQAPQLRRSIFVATTGTDANGDLSVADLLSSPVSPRAMQSRGIDQDLAAIVYTSGTTGVPKGVMLTHENIVAASASIASYLGLVSTDIILNVLPLSFDYGLYQVLLAMRVGATVILERSFAYPSAVLGVLERERVTVFPIVPTIAALLVRQDVARYDLSPLRLITSTGAAWSPTLIARLRAMLPNARIYSMYGITEAKRVSFLDPSLIDKRPGSVGKPMPGVEVFVVDEHGQLRDRGTGQLVVRGRNVMQGYWGMPDETARVLRPGMRADDRLLYTGDIFRIDDDGYMYFVARADDIIKSRGEKVSPKEVENAVFEVAGVADVAVIGVPDPVLGESIKAFVVADACALSSIDILRHCARTLESYMVPQCVEFVADLPRTSSGKVDRLALAQLDRSKAMERAS